ncbi:MAG: hypothetical protein ACK5MT_04465 [Actinomycetales bacterium]
MGAGSSPTLTPIVEADLPDVGAFLHDNLDRRLSSAQWSAAIAAPWPSPVDHHGFQLTHQGRLVGVNLAFYSRRRLGGREVTVCNLGGLAVLPEYRGHSFRLIRALLKQPDTTFTDLSPSGAVIETNLRLGFTHLDVTTFLCPTRPVPRVRGIDVIWDEGDISHEISTANRGTFNDHRQVAAARQLLLVAGNDQCHVLFRPDRRKGRRLFASVLYASDPELFHAGLAAVSTGILVRHRLPFMLIEPRVTGAAPRFGWRVSTPRPRMFRSDQLGADDIDYLYSELVCVPW